MAENIKELLNKSIREVITHWISLNKEALR